MAGLNSQKQIVDAIEQVVDLKLAKQKTTSSRIGIVKEDPVGFEAKVSIGEDVYDCTLPEHLHTWIQKGDVVIVQDLYADGSRLMITGKTGSTMETPSLVFFEGEHAISGVDVVIDGNGEKIDTAGTILE